MAARYMDEDIRKKDKVKMDEMQREIDAAEAEINAEAAEEETEAAAAEDTAAPADGAEAPEASSASKEAETGDPQAEIDKLEAALKEKDDRCLRLQADFENFRRRTTKEREELSAVVTQELLKDLLPILDNFDRAMAAEQKDGDAFKKGVEMLYNQFYEILQKDGLEVIEAEGKAFDPNYHQAVMRTADPDKEDDTVSQVLQKGYMVKGRVIRPSMVQVVANG